MPKDWMSDKNGLSQKKAGVVPAPSAKTPWANARPNEAGHTRKSSGGGKGNFSNARPAEYFGASSTPEKGQK